MMLWLSNIKNAIFAGIAAVLGMFVMWFRWSAMRFEKQAKEAKAKADQESYRAAGAEAAVQSQAKGAEVVKKVQKKAAAKPKPNTKKRDDLESGW